MLKVSVIIKGLNEESNIARAIESSLAAVAPYGGEVILADSASTDRTIDIALQYPITVVQLCNPEERCCGIAAQLGYQHSHGEYIYILDGDMKLDSSFLKIALDFLQHEPQVAGVGGLLREMQTQALEFKVRTKRGERIRANRPLPADRALTVGWIDGGGLYRRAAIDDVFYLTDRNLHAYEEYDLGARLRIKEWRLVRLQNHAVDHYGYAMNAARMLWYRVQTGYVLGTGDLLRASVISAYLKTALIELRALRIFGIVLISWIVVLMIVMFAPHLSWAVGALCTIFLAPVIAMSLRQRSIKLGLYSVAQWHIYAFGLLIGIFGKRKPPGDPIESRIFRTAYDHVSSSGIRVD